ncbi:hypothetical protein F53441_6877 [Fusarium austroafricanum]|uniref:Uncharacterized protein n=1 Tax=Fusarium austroafricanum TaxID=2364996 RepID=A0A8H4NY74_9HYPO|nr:hypothetical protein F53441_6877 [Fusarium austroafricanum]
MPWIRGENTKLRARQLQRLHELHQTDPQGDLVDTITLEDIELAEQLQPDFRDVEDDPPFEKEWIKNPKSLPQVLRQFRKNAQDLIDNPDSQAPDLSRLATPSAVDELSAGEESTTVEEPDEADEHEDYKHEDETTAAKDQAKGNPLEF